jgi:hypothetical protein
LAHNSSREKAAKTRKLTLDTLQLILSARNLSTSTSLILSNSPLLTMSSSAAVRGTSLFAPAPECDVSSPMSRDKIPVTATKDVSSELII